MNLKAALAGLDSARDGRSATKPAAVPDRWAHLANEARAAKPKPGDVIARGHGKVTRRQNPDFEQLKAYVPVGLKKRAERKWEDETGGNISELVEHLLHEYLGR